MSNQIYNAVNWNNQEDDFTQMFWEQNVRQFWVDTEIPISKDIKSWTKLSESEKDTYKNVLAGLTLLDTIQSNKGMPHISEHIDGLQRKSVLNFMSMMEGIHAKSYSTIFTTLINKHEIDELFEWVKDNKYLQYKAQMIDKYYQNINDNKSLYKAMVASVFLESFLFYSGFFYPLYLAGQGKMVNSGEIINLIIRDESIHGIFVGLLAQELYNELPKKDQIECDEGMYDLLEELMDNEVSYTKEVYGEINLHHEVFAFINYNANKALQNLGKESLYDDEEVNPIVLNGLDTESKTHDFFSVKGNSYQKGNVEDLTDDHFEYVNEILGGN